MSPCILKKKKTHCNIWEQEVQSANVGKEFQHQVDKGRAGVGLGVEEPPMTNHLWFSEGFLPPPFFLAIQVGSKIPGKFSSPRAR